MNENGLSTALEDFIHIVLGNLGLTLQNHLVTLDGNNLTSILIDKVFIPALQHTGCQLGTDNLLQSTLVDFDLLGKIEYLQDVLIGLETDSTQQGCNGQLLLTINVRIHNIINVSSELNPRTLERNDTGRVEQRTVGMNVLTEEYAGRTVQLRYNDALGTIDDKGTVGSHVRNGTQEHILNHRAEILMVGIRAIEFQLSLQGYAIRQTTLQALVNGVTGRVDIVIQELKNEIITKTLIAHRENPETASDS